MISGNEIAILCSAPTMPKMTKIGRLNLANLPPIHARFCPIFTILLTYPKIGCHMWTAPEDSKYVLSRLLMHDLRRYSFFFFEYTTKVLTVEFCFSKTHIKWRKKSSVIFVMKQSYLNRIWMHYQFWGFIHTIS